MKKNILNIILLAGTYFLPLYFMNLYKDSSILIGKIQTPIHMILFLGSALLTYLNHKNRKKALIRKWWWLVFEIIGIAGLLYSTFVLVILFLFRNCCGF